MKKNFLIILILIFVLFFIIFINKNKQFNKDIPRKTSNNQSCITEKVVKIVKNVSMEPLIMPGEELMLLEGYYNCNNIKRGDVVAYDSASADYPLIKKVLVMGGDSLEFQGNNLLVNNNILKNSASENYIFKKNEKKMISLYIKDGKLKANTYFIFGDNVYNSIDSKNFGAVSKKGFIGKFILEK